MTLHKLTAGDGYDYLSRQVARMDATETGHTSLHSYYSEKGERPGRWIGSGMADIEGLDAGDIVSSEHMKSLFALGNHPLAQERLASVPHGAPIAELRRATRLGHPFRGSADKDGDFKAEVAERLDELGPELFGSEGTDINVLAQIRTEVATEMFIAEHKREPLDVRELSGFIAERSRPNNKTIAGFDFSFSPVKSVSTLWALADPTTAQLIEDAHDAAVADALEFIESQALFTRTGHDGAQQVEVTGLVAVAFRHRDSRAGDPDLHTHVAVANKVRMREGDQRWLAIDGRALYKAKVTASETYNTALERHLAERIGVRFAPRTAEVGKRPVREIMGVSPALNEHWSKRRAHIEVRRSDLVREFRARHGRPPTATEAFNMNQRATLETREHKHAPRSEAEQRSSWSREAAVVLGGDRAVRRMVGSLLGRKAHASVPVTSAWLEACSGAIVAELGQHRSRWQRVHVQSEALRQVRDADLKPRDVKHVVSLLVHDALSLSVLIATDADGIVEPSKLRRSNGESKYHQSGSSWYTSQAVLDAEVRTIAAAGLDSGIAVERPLVEAAITESAFGGVALDAGQAQLVREMAMSGKRLQVGIAAAGTGKTVAMRTLSRAWESGGGNVIGLAPSATAAAELGRQTMTSTDTVAKLVHDIRIGRRSIAASVSETTLVLVDEAGMAGTLDLDVVVQFALERGASVRLIGDDQQLSAIDSGGVLRDIDAIHGVVRLTELHRFHDPAEGAATLALRDGLPEAIGYYLDMKRVHVGDTVSLVDEVFAAWHADVGDGKDSIMLAPTRELVRDLNARARKARIGREGRGEVPFVPLSDGNRASVGDSVITRENNRGLMVSTSDWVKNGDRWIVLGIESGTLRVKHQGHGREVVLPRRYVAEHVELGYASTVHTAQGVTTETMHGLATGGESRQQLYTMMTRGKEANHLYLMTVGEGAEHDLYKPETVIPPTATDILEKILVRDSSSVSATTTRREAEEPAIALGHAVERYVDSLHFAAMDMVAPKQIAAIEAEAENLVPGIEDEPAWPTLRSHLILIESARRNALQALVEAVAERPLDGVRDRAATLDWRIDLGAVVASGQPPLPWLPATPTALANSEEWGRYLADRAKKIVDTAELVRRSALAGQPPSGAGSEASTSPELLAEVAVWRGATKVDPADRRLTGPKQVDRRARGYQRVLEEQVGGHHSATMSEWLPLLAQLEVETDAFTPVLVDRLAAINRSGIPAFPLVTHALESGPLPDDHASAALWWRISRDLNPTVATAAHASDVTLEVDWSHALTAAFGEARAVAIETSQWWPSVVGQVEHAVRRGWSVEQLFTASDAGLIEDADPAQALMWRIAVLLDPPQDAWEPEFAPDESDHVEEPHEDALDVAARNRFMADVLGPSESMVQRSLDRAYEWDRAPIPGHRVVQINTLAADFYAQRLSGSWAEAHLCERFGQSGAIVEWYRPGYAPKGWTSLSDHLRTFGVTDGELVAAGLAKVSSRGTLIDRFRDRLVMPIIHDGKVLGFVGRRNPASEDATSGPKYLNTSDTSAFSKGAQLFGIADSSMSDGAIPVVVEGSMDAIAVTIATAGAYVGVAPLGTALTEEQAVQLAMMGTAPIIATDADLAGQLAAHRDYWMVAQQGLDARHARLPLGEDPASMVTAGRLIDLRAALYSAVPLSNTVLTESLLGVEGRVARLHAGATIVGARPAGKWAEGSDLLRRLTGLPQGTVASAVAVAAEGWTADPRRVAAGQIDGIRDIRKRMEKAESQPLAERWAPLANALDQRIVGQPDWSATAQSIQALHESGVDTWAVLARGVNERPLGTHPGQDVRLLIAEQLPMSVVAARAVSATSQTVAREESRAPDIRPSLRGPSR